MKEWRTYRIGDICKRVCSGGTPKSTEQSYYNGDIPWLNTKEINFNRISSTEKGITQSGLDNSSAKWIDKDSVIVAMYGATAAKVAINTIPLTTNQACCNLSINENIADYRFVYFWLCANYATLASLANGGAQQNLNAQQIKDFEIKLPDLATQQKIADILWSIDDKINCNYAINDNLEQQAQALYKQWFVDFEFPNEEGKPYKSSGGKMADSELGPIPDGWRVGLLKDIVDFQSGFPFKSELFSEQGTYRLITIKGVQDGYLDVNGAVYIKNIPDRMPPYCLLTEGDIIMSLTGNVGRCCIVDRENLLLNQRVVKLQPTFINSNMFIYTMFRRESFKEKLIALAKGTAQANLSPIETANMRTITPSASCLVRFNKLGQSIFKQLLKNIKENNRLAALRDTLLPKLMSGELSVEDVSVD